MLKFSMGQNILRIFSNLKQVTYSSSPISLSRFKTVASIVFFRYLAYKVKMPKFSKGKKTK